MKKFTSLIILFAGGSLLSFLLLLAGCEKHRDAFFIFTSIEAIINNNRTIGDPAFPIVPVSYDSFFLSIQLEQQQTGSSTAGIYIPVNNAYAFTFSSPYTYRNADAIKQIKVITLQDYNNNYTAGSDISPICTYSAGSIGTITADALIQRCNTYSERDDTYYNLEDYHHYQIHLSEPPEDERNQQFVVMMLSENNTVLTDTTNSFLLKP